MSNLYEQYQDRRETPPTDPAKVALFGIIADLTETLHGLDSEFDAIDDDIKEEMLGEWLDKIKNSLPAETVKSLKECRDLLAGVSAEEVDDPEEYLTSFACEGEKYKEAIDVVLNGFGHNE